MQNQEISWEPFFVQVVGSTRISAVCYHFWTLPPHTADLLRPRSFSRTWVIYGHGVWDLGFGVWGSWFITGARQPTE